MYVNIYVNCNYAHVFNKFVCLKTIVFVFKEEKYSEEVVIFHRGVKVEQGGFMFKKISSVHP